MSKNIIVRPNICDYIVETSDGCLILMKDPIDWQNGEIKSISTSNIKGINIKLLCDLLCQETNFCEITYNQMYEICESVLQIEESREKKNLQND